MPAQDLSIYAGVRGGPVTQNTTNLITVSLLPVAILMIGYAITTYVLRSIYLQRKQVQPCSSPAMAKHCHVTSTAGRIGYCFKAGSCSTCRFTPFAL